MSNIRIIGKSNGFGLTRDLEILAAALRKCGAAVTVVAASRRDASVRRSRLRRWLYGIASARAQTGASPYDLNIMLEHAWPQYLWSARLTVLVPNPEWCDRHDRRQLLEFDQIWAKTNYAHGLFSAMGLRSSYIGFDSLDCYDASVTRERRFLHLAGNSQMKGTARLLEVWSRHPEWPNLTVVRSPAWAPQTTTDGGNITELVGYMSDAALRRLQNECLFHLCTSEAEGWGHYIVEGMSAAAVVISVDAPPMNELASPVRAMLVATASQGSQNLAATSAFCAESLERIIERVIRMPRAEMMALGQHARQWTLSNRDGFSSRLRGALDILGL